MNLEQNLIDNILECEVKLGFDPMPISFYYPLTSLLELLECSENELPSAVSLFQEKEINRLGTVTIERLSNEQNRYKVKIPADGVIWVHENFVPSEFTRQFISEIKKTENTFDSILKLFKSFSSDVEVEQVDEDEWSIGFKDLLVDPYVYHIEQNAFGLEYHRFTREAYQKLMHS